MKFVETLLFVVFYATFESALCYTVHESKNQKDLDLLKTESKRLNSTIETLVNNGYGIITQQEHGSIEELEKEKEEWEDSILEDEDDDFHNNDHNLSGAEKTEKYMKKNRVSMTNNDNFDLQKHPFSLDNFTKFFTVDELRTEITVEKDSCDGRVYQYVRYTLEQGRKHAAIMHKVSHLGTAVINLAYVVKPVSLDLDIIETKIIYNCYSKIQQENHQYSCLMILFKKIDATKEEKQIEIAYRYVALGFLRFDTDSDRYYFETVYDNEDNKKGLNNITHTVSFQTEKGILPKVFGLPNNIAQKENDLVWIYQEVSSGSLLPFSGNFTNYDGFKNVECREMENKPPNRGHFVVLQIVNWIYLILFYFFLIGYTTINEEASYFTLIKDPKDEEKVDQPQVIDEQGGISPSPQSHHKIAIGANDDTFFENEVEDKLDDRY